MDEILILSAGRRVSLLRNFQKAAAERGMVVVTADKDPAMSSACRLADASIALPHVFDPAFSDALLAYCRAHPVRLVVPTIDTELAPLAHLSGDLAALGAAAVVCDPDLVAVCRDKRRTKEHFDSLGLLSPALYAPDALRYPALAKPYDGSLSAGLALLRSSKDLTDAIVANPRNIYCEYLEPNDYAEYTCDAYFDAKGRIRCVVPRLRIEVRGGEVAKSRTEKNNIVPLLFAKLRQLDGARGCLTIQILRHRTNGELRLVEVNPRFGGGYPLTAACGAPYHAWLIDEHVLGREIAENHDWEDGMLMLRYDSEVFVAA